ncbi:MAG: glycoside hydrolase family 97 protein [Verrucomicrobia bacterium]|nr:glycoside hydrolase family 97 protein [Verrucomicrobiota bacterium]
MCVLTGIERWAVKNLYLPFCAAALLICGGNAVNAEESLSLKSPDGRFEVRIQLGEDLSYSVLWSGQTVVSPSCVGMELADGTVLGKTPELAARTTSSMHETIKAPLYRFSEFNTAYQELDLRMKDNYGVIFRAYNEGVAYRLYTQFDSNIEVKNERAEFNFPEDWTAWIAYSTNQKDPFATSFENLYATVPLSKVNRKTLAFTPTTLDLGGGRKLTLAESDLESYPGMFLKATEGRGFTGVFAPVPVKLEADPSARQEKVKEYGNVIARTQGKRTFPWRVILMTESDKELPVSKLLYALASPSRIADTSWIHAGKSAWDWWSEWGVYNVDFKVGANTQTYKYYIDFAAKYGLEYMTLDASWYHLQNGDMMKTTEWVDMPAVAAYAKERGVGLVLWTAFAVLDRQLEEACKYYSSLGIKGFKVDFLERDDQLAVEQAYRIAETAARYHLILDYHGFYKPTGLNRTWPNVVNFEGVYGLENAKWMDSDVDMPKYDVTMPFMRMMAGPVDYTPGAMRNAIRSNFKSIYKEPMSQGTRCHQLAEYIVFDAPFAMLCDTPVLYEQEPEYTRFLASIPVEPDETQILSAELGKYIVTARRKGDVWFVGGLTGWNVKQVDIPFSFLKKGQVYQAVLYKDGVNSERRGADYTVDRFMVNSADTRSVRMSSGGGFALRLTPVDCNE